MNDNPANHPNRSPGQETITDAAQNIADLIAHANPEERLKLVEALGETLNDADVIVIDTSVSDEGERRGVRTGLTREVFINAMDARRALILRRRRMSERLGRLATRYDS